MPAKDLCIAPTCLSERSSKIMPVASDTFGHTVASRLDFNTSPESIDCLQKQTPHVLDVQVEQHKWAEEGAELKGRLTAHEAQLEVMQVARCH